MSTKIKMAALLQLLLITAQPVHAGVTLDGTLGRSGAVTGPNYAITPDLGKQAGTNLFHSFSKFDLVKGDIATFSGPTSISNIISRVTGGSASSIDGTMKSTITGANMYFLNPAGVMFGPNASIDISGSFHVSTADYLKLGTDGRFDVAIPGNSVLTTSAPSAFGFAAAKPAGITVNGSMLSVVEGKGITVTSGDFTITNGNLYAPGGKIDVLSVASSGEASFTQQGLTKDGFSTLGAISITDTRASDAKPKSKYIPDGKNYNEIGNIDASGAGGGAIYVRGGVVTTSGGWIWNDNYGDKDSGNIEISAKEMTLSSNSIVGGSPILGIGNGGQTILSADKITIKDSTVNNSTYASGNSGSIVINAGDLAVTGTRTNERTGNKSSAGIYNASSTTDYNPNVTGNGGNINITANNVYMSDGATINSSTVSSGNGGDISIKATDSVTLTGVSKINSSTAIASVSTKKGNAGNISIQSDKLNLLDGAVINAEAQGEGKGGNLVVTASDSINLTGSVLDGVGKVRPSAISLATTSTGNAGSLALKTGKLNLINGGQILTSSYASGTGATATIDASDSVNISGKGIVDGSGAYYTGGIFAQSSGSGNAGSLAINTTKLNIADGNEISLKTTGDGKGADLTLKATDSINVSGGADTGSISSSVALSTISSGTSSKGNSGTILLNTAKLNLSNGGRINSSTIGEGTGGNITVSATDSVNMDGGFVSSGGKFYYTYIQAATSSGGNAGTLTINTNKFNMSDGASIDLFSNGSGVGGTARITAADSVNIKDVHIMPDGSQFTTGINSSAQKDGNAGELSISTGKFTLDNGGAVRSFVYGDGTGSEIVISATDSINIGKPYTDTIYTKRRYPSGIVTEVREGAKGNTGFIVLGAPKVNMSQGGVVSVNTNGDGTGGGIAVIATDRINIDGVYTDVYGSTTTGIYARTSAGGTGGYIDLITGTLNVTSGATVSASVAAGAGQGGDIKINVNSLNINQSVIDSGSAKDSQGNAGNILISAGTATISNGGIISVSTNSSGIGGNLFIDAKNSLNIDGVYIKGDGTYRNSSIDAETTSTGNAGTIDIRTNKMNISAGGVIDIQSYGDGVGGSAKIYATDSVTINGYITSGVSAATGILNSSRGNGPGGELILATGKLNLIDGGVVSASTYAAGAGGTIGISASDSINIVNAFTNSTTSNITASKIASEVRPNATGDSGVILLVTPKLNISQGGQLSVASYSKGLAGGVYVQASDSINIDGVYSSVYGDLPSSIKATTSGGVTIGGLGGGLIKLETGKLSVTGGASISAESISGFGRSGEIDITASDFVIVSGRDSKISANSTSGGDAGQIKISTGNLNINEGASISSTTTFASGGDISIRATGAIDIKGSLRTDTIGRGDAGRILIDTGNLNINDLGSISSAATVSGSGKSGDITIKTSGLEILNGGLISVATAGTGSAGNISISADKVLVEGKYVSSTGKVYNSKVSAETTSDTGNAGNVQIKATQVTLSNTGEVSTNTSAAGAGGNISVDVTSLDMTNKSSISSTSTSTGKAGNLDIKATDSIKLIDSGFTTATSGKGDAGTITIAAPRITLEQGASIASDVRTGGTGNAGSINLHATDTITISSGTMPDGTKNFSQVSSATEGGNAGSILIEAPVIDLKSGANITTTASKTSTGDAGTITLKAPTSLTIADLVSSGTDAGGKGGSIILESPNINVTGSVKANTAGSGNAGNISVTTGLLTLSNSGAISTNAQANSSGNAGNVNIQSGEILLTDKALISSESLGTGTAGNIDIKAVANIKLTDSSISTASESAGGGSITIDPVLVHLKNSSITTSVKGGTGGGGNIDMTAKQLILDNSKIIAQADAGKGGNINLNVDVIIQSPTGSEISASSNKGIQGSVILSSPVLDVNAALVEMPSALRDIASLSPRRCITTGDDISSFVVYSCGASARQPDATVIGK